MYYFENINELKSLLPSLFTSDELSKVGYGDYTDSDLEVILGRSEGFLDTLRYRGSFSEEYQAHAFPRKLDTGYVVEKNDVRVLKGLCSIFYDYLLANTSNGSREELIRQGVKSISTAGVSESYGSYAEIEKSKISLNYQKYLDFVLFKKFI